MDLQTRDRAAADVAPLPAGQPGLRVPGDRAGARAPRDRALVLAIAALAALIAVVQANRAGVAGPGAVPAVVKTSLATVGLFGVCGYGVARLALPRAWLGHLVLFTLPVGAAASTLALSVLGLLHVPLAASSAAVLAAGVALAAVAVRRPLPPREPVLPVAAALLLAALVASIVLLPSFRAGYATVSGQNGDAVLAVGTANLLQHAPPTAVRPDLPLDRVPIQWRSKLPIYYGLAAVAQLAGQDTTAAFPTVLAIVVALAALGVFLFVVLALGAPAWVGLLALFLVGLDRINVHVGIHPYYNQGWALFALPFTLLLGWRALAAPSRGTALLAALFAALALFAYPLLLPFPAVFLAVVAWQRRAEIDWRGALRVDGLRRRRWLWPLLAIVAIPVVAVLVRGVVEKVGPAISAVRPGGDLSGWSGGHVLPYLPFGRFLGIDGRPVVVAVVVAGVLVAAVLGLLASRRDVARALAVLLAGALLGAAYIRARGEGEFFWFKAPAFPGPLLVALAVVGLALRAPRGVGIAGLAVLTLMPADGPRREIRGTYEQLTRTLLQVHDWDREIPANESIRLDIPPIGWQLWGWYELPRPRVSAPAPLGGFFPPPPRGSVADLALVKLPAPRPRDAVGPPLRANADFRLYRLRPSRGRDTSSRALLSDVKRITY